MCQVAVAGLEAGQWQFDKPMLGKHTCSGRRGTTRLCMRDARVGLPS
jgi:hypothetical protein